MQKSFIRKPISVLLSLLMILSVFGGMAFTASAAGEDLYETLDFGANSETVEYEVTYEEPPEDEEGEWTTTTETRSTVAAKAFSGEHFSVTPTPYTIDDYYGFEGIYCSAPWGQGTFGWKFDDYYPQYCATIRATTGDTLKKLVVYRAGACTSNNDAPPRLTVNGEVVPYTTTDNLVYTYDNLDAAEVQLRSANDGNGHWIMCVAKVDAYYSVASADDAEQAAAAATVTITAADLGVMDIYGGDASANGVNIHVNNGRFKVRDYIFFHNKGEYVISMADGSLITKIVLSGEEISDTKPAGDGWSGYEWSNPDGAASVTQTEDVWFIDSITITYIAAGDTIEINFNDDNAEIQWHDSCSDEGYWDILANDGATYSIELSNSYSEQAAGTYAWDDMDEQYCYIIIYENGVTDYTDYLVDGSCTVTVDGGVVTVSGTFTGESGNTYVITITTASGSSEPDLDQEAADAVIALINDIGEVAYTAECAAKIDAARAAYDALTDAQKELVSNYETLTAAEDAYAAAAALAEAKTNAKAELDSYKNADDYRAAEQETLAAAIAAGKTAIDAAADTAAVATALADAKTAIDAIKTDAQLTAEEEAAAAAALAEAKTNAKAELDAYKNADDYREAEQADLAAAIAAGKDAIDAAADTAAVATALADAKTAIDAIKTDAQLTAEEEAAAAAALAEAKTNAKAELDAYKNADDYREAEQADLAAAIAAGKDAIDEAADAAAVATALADAKTAIDAIKTDAQLTAEEEAAAAAALAEAKTNAKAELDAYKNADDYREAEQADLAAAIAAGKDAIDNAANTDAVATALANAKAAIDEIKTDAELTAEEEAAAAAALTAAKSDAKDALDNYVNADDYRAAEQADLAAAIAAGKTAIDNAADTDAVAAALAEAKAAIDAIKTDAQLTAEEEAAAVAALAEAKTNAKAELDAYKNADDYRDAEQAELAAAITAGKEAIDNAESIADVEAALADAKAAIDEIKTDAELTAAEEAAAAEAAANQAAADEVTAKIAAIGEVEYTDESKAKIDEARAAYDALTDAQKALVENYETLTAAESRYNELKTAAGNGLCKWCGKDHSVSFWQKIVGFFHSVLYFFAHLFGKR